MNIHKFNRPILFYVLATAAPWGLWFIATYVSHLTPYEPFHAVLVTVFGVSGLSAPMIIAFILIWKDPALKDDVLSRFLNFKTIKLSYILLACGLMLGSILLAQAISLLFGYSASQFALSENFSFTAGIYYSPQY